MRRFLAIVVALLVIGIWLERMQTGRQRHARELASTLRPLAAVTAEQVATIRVWPAGSATEPATESASESATKSASEPATKSASDPATDPAQAAEAAWIYALRGASWRYPLHHDAYADATRIEQLLRALCGSLSTVVGIDPARHSHYGLSNEQPVRIHLIDGAGDILLQAVVGRGAPGPAAGECYVRLARADTVYHLHANPRHALAWDASAPAPMLDPHVLPRALARRSIVALRTSDPSHRFAPLRMRRIEVETEPAGQPGRQPDGPTFVWMVAVADEEVECELSRAYDYVRYVRELKYESLLDPVVAHGSDAGARGAWSIRGASTDHGARLEIEDEEGTIDVLQLIDRPHAGEPDRLLLNQTTGQTCLIPPGSANLLFPTTTVLLDTTTSPYRR